MRSSQVKGFYSNGCFYTLTLILLVFFRHLFRHEYWKTVCFWVKRWQGTNCRLGFCILGNAGLLLLLLLVGLLWVNHACLKCLSICPSTKSFFDFNEIWYAGRGRWCTMTRSKVKVTSPWKLQIRPFSKPISSPFPMGAEKWPRILKIGHNT